MKRFLPILLCSSLYCSIPGFPVPQIPNLDDFTPQERDKIARSMPGIKQPIILPTMTVKFDIIIDGDSILYDCPVFKLNDEMVICQICGRPPVQIEITNGNLKCYCFNHIPRKRGSFLD